MTHISPEKQKIYNDRYQAKLRQSKALKKPATPLTFQVINTETVEREAIRIYTDPHSTKADQLSVFKTIVDIWKYKYKIPSDTESKTDFSDLFTPFQETDHATQVTP
jgi:hypothetical protein